MDTRNHWKFGQNAVGKGFRRFLSLVLVIAMLLPWTLTAQAAENQPEDMAGVPAPQSESVTVGDFTVTGGVQGTDYKFENNTLKILTATPITISNTDPNTATSNHIDVVKDISADITLAGLNIDVSGNSGIAALYITNDSSGNVTITLAEGTTNTLKSGENCAGLQKNGTNGTLTINGTGILNATGGTRGAGIGGGYRGSGTVTINGGTVIATGGSGGAGIGGGMSSSGGSITIIGGTVTATGGKEGGAGIGDGGYGGSGSSFNTGTEGTSGNGFIDASSISDQSGKTDGTWSGVIIEGNKGQVYGNPTLNTDAAIPEGKTVTVPAETSLTVGTDTTLTNNGTLKLDGGSVTGSVSGNVPIVPTVTEDMIQVPTGLYYDGTDQTAKIQNETKLKLNDQEVTAEGWTLSVTKVDELHYTVTYTQTGTENKASKDVTLAQSGTALTAVLKDGKTEGTYNFSDEITITVTIAPSGASPAVLTTRAGSVNAGEVEVYAPADSNYCADYADVTLDASGRFVHTFTLDKWTKRDLTAGEKNTVKIIYSGCEFMAAAETTLTITLNPCTQHQFNRDGQCEWCGLWADVGVTAAGGEREYYLDMGEAWAAACAAYDPAIGVPVTVAPRGDAIPVNSTLTLSNGEKIELSGFGSGVSGDASLSGPVVKVTNGELILGSMTTIVNANGNGVEVSGNGTFVMSGGTIAGSHTSVQVSGGSFIMNGGTLGTEDGITSNCALEVSGETASVTIYAGDSRQGTTLEGTTAVYLTADAAVTIQGGTFSGTTSGLKADTTLTKTKLSGGMFSKVEVTSGTVDSLLETDYAYYEGTAKVADAAAPVLDGPVSVMKDSAHSTGDLDLHNVRTNQGDLDADGYSWEYSESGCVLTLKNCTVAGTITLPNQIPVTVKVEGESYVGGNIGIENIGTYADGCQITFAGSEPLYVAGRIGWDSGSHNEITISAEANVTAAGGLGIPGGVTGVLTVNGTLNAVGNSRSAISTGKVVINSGSLNVSGAEGVSLSGIYYGSYTDIENAFNMQGGTFSSSCTDYSVRLTGHPATITEANAQSAFHFPADHYIPAGYSVQYASDGEYNAVVAIAPDNAPDAVLLSGTGMGGNIVLMQYYTTTVDAGITNGTVTVSPTPAAAGDTVTLTLTPADGYYAGVPTVTAGGNSVAVSQAEGTYTFTMPASDVIVTADFVKQTGITDDSISVTLASGTYTYTGSEHKPAVTVMKGSTPLTEGTDYTVTYSGNTNAGDATVTVTGKGVYTGIKTETFHIDKAALTITGAALETREYDRGSVNATVTDVTFDGLQNGESLTLGTDCTATAEFTDANAGKDKTATVTVTLPDNSNYAFANGANTANYDLTGQTIRPKAITVTLAVSPESMEYTGGERKPSVEVSCDGTVVNAAEYKVSYTDNILPGTATVTVTGIKNYSFTATGEFTITCPHPGMENGECTVCHETIAATVKVGEKTTYYTDITSAWSFAQGRTATITMLIDQNISSALEMNSGNLTLTMTGGAKLNRSGTAILIDGGTLTLENCDIEVTGSGSGLYISGGVVDITNCIITKSSDGNAISVSGGTVNVYSGTFTGAYTSSKTAGLYVSSGDAHLYGGTYVSNFPQRGCSIYDKSGNIGRFLAEGYAYKQSGAWFTGNNEKELYDAVQVLPIPVKITAQPTSPAAVEYGYTNAPTLSVTVEMPEGISGEISYTWHEVDAAESRLRGSKADTYTVPTGLSVGPHQYYCEVECDGYILKSNTVTVTVNKKTLTPTITGTTEKVYDGTSNVLNGCSIKLEGVVEGDIVSATAKNYIYDSADAGERTITATGITLNGADKDNYTLSSDTVAGNGKITRKSPAITFANNQEITYGDTPIEASVDSGGKITYSYVIKDSNMEAVSGWPTDVGTYTVTATAAATKNYQSGSKSITLTINRQPIQVPTVEENLIYNGDTQTGVKIVGEGYSLTGNTAENAGTYEATATLDGNHIWQLADGTLSVLNQTITWSIKQKDITVEITANGGTYNGNPYPATAVLADVVIGEKVNVTLTYTDGAGYNSTDAPKNAGSYTVTASISDPNYNLTGTVSKVFTITKAGSGLNVPAPAEKTYGDADFNLNATQTGNGTLTYTSADETVATVDENGNVRIVGAGSTVITVTAAENGNYQTISTDVTVNVHPKTLTPGISTTEKVYDGTTNAPNGCTIALNGVVGEDEVTAAAESCTYDSAGAGDRTITATGITLTGAASGNYVLSAAEITAAGKITKRAPEITFADQTITFGETPTAAAADSNGTFTYSYKNQGNTVNGWPENAGTYTVTATVGETANYQSGSKTIILTINKKAVTDPVITLSQDSYVYDGTEKKPTVIVKDVDSSEYQVRYENNINAGQATVTVTANGNYSFVGSVIFRIDPASISAASVAVTGSYTYHGKAQTPAVTATLNGKELTEGVDYTLTSVTDNVNAGTASVTVTGKGNYTDTANTTFRIAQAPLTVTANPQTITYGGSIATDTEQVTVTGLVNGEILAGITLTPSTEDVPGGEITAANAVIKPADGSADVTGNYAITYTVGKLTIRKAKPTFIFENQTITYGGTPTNATVDSLGVISYSYEYQGSTLKGWPVNAGTYTVTATVGETANYQSGSKTIILTINRKPIQVPTGAEGLIYDGETRIGVADGTGYTLTGNTAENAGTYEATATLDGNHIWQLADGTSEEPQSITWSIARKEITVAITANGGTYNGNPIPATAKLNGVVAGDEVAVTLTYTDGAGYNSTDAPKNADSYTVTASISNPNYNLTGTVEKDFTISKAGPGLNVPAPAEKTYGDVDFNLNATQTGNGTLTYTSGDETVATVDENGKIHIVGAGSAVITVTAAENGNYQTSSAEVTVTVHQKTLTPSISITEKVYDGTTNAPDGCIIQLSGVAGNDDVTAAADSCIYDNANAGDRKITASGIKLSGAASGNYVLSAAEITAAGKITKRAPEITFDNQTISYGGTPKAATADSKGTITYSYVVKGSTMAAVNGLPVNAGTYTVTAAVAETDNYQGGSKSITLTINRKPIQVPEAVTGLIYNGETQTGVETGTGYTLSSNTAKNAGDYTAIATVDSNHIWKLAEGTSGAPQTIAWSIAKKDITVEITANGGIYNGNPYPATAKLIGLEGVDKLSATLTYTDSEGNTSTNAPVNAGDYTVAASIPEGNYSLTGTVSKSFTISKAGQELNVPAPSEKTYGDADFNLNATQTGNETLTYTSADETVATVDENGKVHIVGAGSTVITVTAAESDNYAAESVTVTVNVGKAAASLTAEAIPEKTYGDEAFDIVYQRTGESNVVFASSDPSVVTADESGKVTVVGAGSAVIKLSMEESGNYLAASTEVGVVVNPKTLTLTIISNGGVSGQPITGAETKLEGLVDGDQADVTLTYTKEGETTGSTTVPQNVGTYTVTATISDPNYIPAEVVIAHFVVRQPITLTVKDVSKIYGEQDPELSYEITEGTILDGKSLNIQLQRTAGENVGSYGISALDAAKNNPCYEITVIAGSLDIQARDIRDAKVILDPALTENGQMQTQTVTGVTVVNSQGEILDVTYTVTGNTAVNAGEYTMTITGTGNFTGTKEQAFTVHVKPTDPTDATEETKPESGSNPGTGDTRWMGLWGMMMLLSAATVAALLEKRKKTV